MPYTTVAKVDSFTEGEGQTFTVAGRLVAVFLHGGEFFAIDDMCPHQGASLGAGAIDDDGAVLCPWHAWGFRLTDGKWCDNPTLGVDTFAVRVDGDDVQVAITAKEDR